MTKRTKAEFALLLATLFWGLTFPFIRISIQEISPLNLVFLRGTIASLLFLPLVLIIKKDRMNLIKLIPFGAVLGFLYFLAYYSQSMGLKTITSGRSAFITNLSVIFVPLLSPIFKRGIPKKTDLLSCIIALIGMYLLTDPFNSNGGINIGDLWTIVTALCFSLQIHTLQWAMDRKSSGNVYAFWQVAFISLFSLLYMPVSGEVPNFSNVFSYSTYAIFAISYLSIVAMVVTTWLQTQYQHHTSPERASVIYIVEPVFACVFGYLILQETMNLRSLFGGFLIILAVIWTYLLNLYKKALKK